MSTPRKAETWDFANANSLSDVLWKKWPSKMKDVYALFDVTIVKKPKGTER
jgi:hypothetical protein